MKPITSCSWRGRARFRRDSGVPFSGRGWPARLNCSRLLSGRLRLVALDLEFILALLRSGDVISRLKAYPGFRRGAEGLGEANRHSDAPQNYVSTIRRFDAVERVRAAARLSSLEPAGLGSRAKSNPPAASSTNTAVDRIARRNSPSGFVEIDPRAMNLAVLPLTLIAGAVGVV